jgi:hypothetical protein
MHAHEAHAYEKHGYEVYAHEVYPYGMRTGGMVLEKIFRYLAFINGDTVIDLEATAR